MRTSRSVVSIAFLSFAFLGTTAHANAEETRPWYVAAGGSLSIQGTSPGTVASVPAPGSTLRIEEHFDPGFGGHFALGRSLGLLRLEGEIGYTREIARRYTAIAPPAGEFFADIRSRTLRAMANAYIDFELGGLRPYVGAGIGYASNDLLVITQRAIFPTEQPRRLIDDSDSGFAYQAMAGVAVPVNDRLDITVGYRWFDEGQFNGVDGRGEAITRERGAHNIDLGLRWRF